MDKIFVSDLTQNQELVTSFLVSRKEIKTKKNGGDYLLLKLGDKTGTISAFLWENVEEFKDAFSEGDYIKVKAQVREFGGNLQLTLFRIRRLEDSEVNAADYLPVSPHDPEEQFTALMEFVEQMKNSDLRGLLERLFSNPALVERFKRAPAAKKLHHAWLGGLLDHTLSLVRLCILMAQHYPQLNADLLVAGAVLHDIGKVEEYLYSRSIDSSDEGRLLGHIIMETTFVNQMINQMESFPQELRIQLLHLLISHHGKMEFGSPKEPMTPEALALHYLDDFDSKLQMMLTAMQEDQTGNSAWTPYLPAMERYVYRRRIE